MFICDMSLFLLFSSFLRFLFLFSLSGAGGFCFAWCFVGTWHACACMVVGPSGALLLLALFYSIIIVPGRVWDGFVIFYFDSVMGRKMMSFVRQNGEGKVQKKNLMYVCRSEKEVRII